MFPQPKRIPRTRIFKFIVNGTDIWLEPAGTRTVLETQHQMATETLPGSFVRVQEQYLGGAKARAEAEETEE